MSEFQHTILIVDDEESILHTIQRLLRSEKYNILTASSGAWGLKVLEKSKVHLIISDQRMPEMSGTEFLAIVKERYPDIIRIILSGYIEVDSITEAVNKGHIYKFLLKPWEDEILKLEIMQALDQYDLQQANKMLHQKVLEQNEALKEMNENLEALVGERMKELLIQNQVLELSRAILDELPVAIIGVGVEGMVVFVNQEAQKLSFLGRKMNVGEEINDYFEEPLVNMISTTLKTNDTQRLNNYLISGRPYVIHSTPLSGKYGGKGVILTFKN